MRLKYLWFLVKLLWAAAVGLATLCWWVWALARNAFHQTVDIAAASRARRGTSLVCPRAHEFPTEGQGLIQCKACGFTYEGSLLICGNPECRAPSQHVACPTCGLSVRNPWRWGRP
jgi:hypothetical protein